MASLVAIGPLTAAQIMLLIDRYLGGHFFDTQAGGSAVIWMHFFWVFGHPEVYILVLPAFAIVSEVIPVFSRKPIFGYSVMVAATVCHRLHQPECVGTPHVHRRDDIICQRILRGFHRGHRGAYGDKNFQLGGNDVGRQDQLRSVPMMFCIAFLCQFLIAGLTGIMLAAAPFDWQLGNSYFVVAHFHYVILGGIVFAVFAGMYYWYPKVSGRMLNETLGKWHFWLFLIGFHLTFDFMHIPGLLGMPRRIYTYEASRGWEIWNIIISIGVIFQALGVLIWVSISSRSYFKGEIAGNDPWDAWTLEWPRTSPPPDYNFAEIPVVRSRRPLWDLKHPEDPDWKYE